MQNFFSHFISIFGYSFKPVTKNQAFNTDREKM